MDLQSSLNAIGIQDLSLPLSPILAVFTFLLLSWYIYAVNQKRSADGVGTPPSVPYSIPFFAHTHHMILNGDTFLKGLRQRYQQTGIFTLSLCSTRHHIIYSPSLTHAFFAEEEKADTNDVGRYIGIEIFGFPQDETEKFREAYWELHGLYKHLISEDDLQQMVAKTMENLDCKIAHLVTENATKSSRNPWEQLAQATAVFNLKGQEVVEASLFPLIRNFIAAMSSASIMGSDFLKNYPTFYNDIWALDRGFFLMLVTPLQQWAPIPALRRARAARRRILQRLEVFHEQLERHTNGERMDPEWSNLDDVGVMVKERVTVYRKYGYSNRARAAWEHSINWASQANSNALTFWMLIRIYMDKELLHQLRAEIEPFVAVQRGSSDSVQAFERFDYAALVEKCTLLKSCYIETLRLHTASWSFKKVQQDFYLQGRKDSRGWLLRKGDYCHAAHELHNTNPSFFEEPLVFKADRHVKFDRERGHAVADLGTIRPYGGGSTMCKGRHFAVREVMAFTAAIISTWEIEPAGGRDWRLPSSIKTTATYGTDEPYRVWLSSRKHAE